MEIKKYTEHRFVWQPSSIFLLYVFFFRIYKEHVCPILHFYQHFHYAVLSGTVAIFNFPGDQLFISESSPQRKTSNSWFDHKIHNSHIAFSHLTKASQIMCDQSIRSVFYKTSIYDKDRMEHVCTRSWSSVLSSS